MAGIEDVSVKLYNRDLRFEFSYDYDFTLRNSVEIVWFSRNIFQHFLNLGKMISFIHCLVESHWC